MFKSCCKKFYFENGDCLIKYQKTNDSESHDRINIRHNECVKNRRKVDLNFKLSNNLRTKTNQASKSQNFEKRIKLLIHWDVLILFQKTRSFTNFTVI